MRIVQIVPGSGGTFYCQNCLRDASLSRQLRAQGHEVTLVPMYLPLAGDTPEPAHSTPVFYGAVNLYLKQRFPVLKHAPHALSRLLDSPRVLQAAAQRAGSTRAKGLVEMTLSMLRGEEGNQAGELEELAQWVAAGPKPDVIHLSNALLLGMARRLSQVAEAPVVCSLQDEDQWIDAMAEHDASKVRELMASKVEHVAGFIAVSRYYAERMQRELAIPEERLTVVPVGIEVEGYRTAPLNFSPPTIGYLSRLSSTLGLTELVEAFLTLKRDPAFSTLRLVATGGSTGDDVSFLRSLQRRFRGAGVADAVEILPEFGREKRIELLQRLSVLSVPVPTGEAFGTYLLEAMAAGVPVVQPAVGASTEIIEATGGGVLYEPGDRNALADALRQLLLDPHRARALGRRGQQAVHQGFTLKKMAERTVEVHRSCLS